MSKVTPGSDTQEDVQQRAFGQYQLLLKSAFEKFDFRAVMQMSYTVAEKYFEVANAATGENPEIDEQRLMATTAHCLAEEFMPLMQKDLDSVEPLSSLLARANA